MYIIIDYFELIIIKRNLRIDYINIVIFNSTNQ